MKRDSADKFLRTDRNDPTHTRAIDTRDGSVRPIFDNDFRFQGMGLVRRHVSAPKEP
jgi:hypothetical protein